MIALRSLAGTGRPQSFPVASASCALERAWRHVTDARDAFAESRLGDTDSLLASRDNWVRSIDEYEVARMRHAEAVRRSQGRHGLTLVKGGS